MQLSHKNLDVWKFSLELVDKIYSITKSFPREELFGLTNQLRRASVSITSNLSEGLSRTSSLEKCRFLEIARSSLVEIDTQLVISVRLKYCSEKELEGIEPLLNSIFAMITSLIKKIKNKT
ncbi:MAG: four helix bundle protein [Melioribacteraceae bacterium]